MSAASAAVVATSGVPYIVYVNEIRYSAAAAAPAACSNCQYAAGRCPLYPFSVDSRIVPEQNTHYLFSDILLPLVLTVHNSYTPHTIHCTQIHSYYKAINMHIT